MRKALIALVGLGLLLGACTSQDKAQQAASDKAANRQYYIPTHDIEFNNYEKRLKLADDPSSIVWCTSAFPGTTGILVTVPIVGKLTSSTKRPFPSDPGPDSMYGSSDPYRYGFSPGGAYWDYSNISMVCTTQPTVWQREATTLVLQGDQGLMNAQTAAQNALKAGHADQAQSILEQAIAQAGASPNPGSTP